MAKIDLKIGSLVFFDNEQYKIYRVVNLSEVSIEHTITKKVLTVNTSQLSSKQTDKKEKIYLNNYSDNEWAEAKKRYEIIKNLVFQKRSRKDVEEAGKENDLSAVTIYNWIKIYEQTSEISSLISKTSQRGKKGSRLDEKVENIVQEILEDLYLNKQRYGFRKIFSKIERECKKLNLETPHENTIRNRIETINPKDAMKKRYGYKAANKHFTNYDGEYPEGNYPLEVVQIDHTPLDIIVVDKVYRKPIGKPYLTLAIDVYSRMIAGLYISLQAPGYFNVSQCLLSVFSKKDMFLDEQKVEGTWEIFGLPRVINVDNGADLVSSDMQRVCDEFGITLLKRPVARPQFGAHVERVLGTINKEVHNLSGTTFSNITQKGTYNSQKEATYTIEELTQWITHYIVNIYHKKYHHGINMSPINKYIKGIFGDDDTPGTGILPSIIDEIDNIKIALLPTFYRTIQKDGITLDGITYYSDVLRHWIGITDDTKNRIQHKIKRDPLNIQKIFFYDPEIKEYFEVPYRRMYAPVMTLWDLYAVKRYLKDNKILNYSEEDLFEAYELLENMEKEASTKQKQTKLRKSQYPKMSNLVQTEDTQNEKKIINGFDSLFDDISTFKVTHKKEDDEN